MYIYNSLTNQREEFKTIEPNKVKMYVCGPTVYNFVHIGNARPVIFFDVVKRYLEHRGYEVTYVSNITDVDDKIINAALKEGVAESDIADKYKNAFLEDVARLHCLPYDVNPAVTGYMDDIIAFIKALEEKGYAYEKDGDVYFSVSKIADYGQLSNQETEYLEIGARITDHSKKDNPLDFTLWKKTGVGIKWDSPWGKGRPGWHTECVAMINDTLGPVIDIHGGGSDLKFPHHENEIAQSEALNQTTLAHYWMHNGRLLINDEKMSKSLGNYIVLKEFLKAYDYRVLRLFMLSTHYRQPLNYTDEVIVNMQNDLDKIFTVLKQTQQKLDYYGHHNESNNLESAYLSAFHDAMDDDFNTSNALSVIMGLIKDLNIALRKGDYGPAGLVHLSGLYQTLKVMLAVLGLDYDENREIPRVGDTERALIDERDALRKEKNYAKADEIRAVLQGKGIII